MCRMLPVFVPVIGSLLLVASAWAQSPQDVPSVVAAAITEAQQACEPESHKLEPDFITQKDVNGDKVQDYILDYDKFKCGDNPNFFCGTAGCLMQVFVSVDDGEYALALDQNVRRLQFKWVKGRPAMLLSLHGSACGRVGAAPCNTTLYWNGATFSPAN